MGQILCISHTKLFNNYSHNWRRVITWMRGEGATTQLACLLKWNSGKLLTQTAGGYRGTAGDRCTYCHSVDLTQYSLHATDKEQSETDGPVCSDMCSYLKGCGMCGIQLNVSVWGLRHKVTGRSREMPSFEMMLVWLQVTRWAVRPVKSVWWSCKTAGAAKKLEGCTRIIYIRRKCGLTGFPALLLTFYPSDLTLYETEYSLYVRIEMHSRLRQGMDCVSVHIKLKQ